jgi:uncharacterized protein
MLSIRKSSIQGKGLFTQEALRRRQKVGEMTGELISVREARRRAQGAERIAIVEVSSTKAIDGSVGDSLFQFVNHCCTPNLFIRVAYGHVEFYALKDIKAGTELTCDYGDSHHEGNLPCRCGSAKCKKFI